MDKEAQKKVEELLGEFLGNVEAYNYKRDAPPFEYSTSRILEALEQLGYRKLPEGEPPLLGADKVFELLGITELPKADEASAMLHQDFAFVGKIAKAQREADIKWYGGNEG